MSSVENLHTDPILRSNDAVKGIRQMRKTPVNKHARQLDLQPMITLSSAGKSYAGTSRLSGAGPFRARPDMS